MPARALGARAHTPPRTRPRMRPRPRPCIRPPRFGCHKCHTRAKRLRANAKRAAQSPAHALFCAGCAAFLCRHSRPWTARLAPARICSTRAHAETGAHPSPSARAYAYGRTRTDTRTDTRAYTRTDTRGGRKRERTGATPVARMHPLRAYGAGADAARAGIRTGQGKAGLGHAPEAAHRHRESVHPGKTGLGLGKTGLGTGKTGLGFFCARVRRFPPRGRIVARPRGEKPAEGKKTGKNGVSVSAARKRAGLHAFHAPAQTLRACVRRRG